MDLAAPKPSTTVTPTANGDGVHKPANGTANGNLNGKRSRPSETKSYKEASDSGEDSEQPLTKKTKTSATKKAPPPEDSDSDVPLKTLTAKVAKERNAEVKSPAQTSRKASSSDKPKKRVKDDSDDDVPLAAISKKRVKEESDEDVPLAAKKPKVKKDASKPKPTAKDKSKDKAKVEALKKAVKKEESKEEEDAEEEEEEYKWWEDPTKGDDSIKWTTLEHNGVVFPPDYVPLPKNVKLHYDGIPVSLHPEAEEAACFYGSMLHSEVNVTNPTFNKNFFQDFKEILDRVGHGTDKAGNKVKIQQFDKCNFRPIFEHFETDRAMKKARSSAEKKEEKQEKDKHDAPYMYCTWDGRKQKVGNFRVEPPGLFRGRGEHPKTGKIKKRVVPEQITINIGKEATVPAPPEGHQWKEVKHDQTGTWLVTWQENINGAYKYVMLAANSDVKGQSDYKKFEKARELDKHIDKIRRDYNKNLKNEKTADRQLATAVYLIDKFALRAGNEKGDEEADTVGCCSLKYEHVTLQPPNKVIFDFLGKDSIRFYNEFEVDKQVFTNLRIFKKDPKKEGDDIFDRVTTSSLNKHLSNYMTGLTAKVFRTYNASRTMSDLLQKLEVSGTIPEKVARYNAANRQVAVLCNHKRTVAAGHEGAMEKMSDKLNGLRYQMWRVKQMMLDIEPKVKKQKEKEDQKYFSLPEDLDQEWVKEHQKKLVEEQREKIKKKFEKDNEKRLADGESKMSGKDLDERLEVADDLEKKYKKENKDKKVLAEGKGPTVEKLENNLEKLNQRLETMKVQTEDKENNKEVALGTSKIVSQRS